MRRICLLLAFLLSLQLFAGMLAPVQPEQPQPVMTTQFETAGEMEHDAARMRWSADAVAAVSVADVAEPEPDSKQSAAQADLEELAMPTPWATLALDWLPFPHLSSDLVDGSSADVDVMLPPPLAAA